MGKTIRASSIAIWLEKSSKLGSLFVNREKRLFLSDDFKLVGKKQNMNPTWKVLMKDVELREPTSFLDNVFFWVVLNENVK